MHEVACKTVVSAAEEAGEVMRRMDVKGGEWSRAEAEWETVP